MSTRLLAGVRVVEAAEVWAGPMGGSLLGDLGADVVKLESFPRSSITRPRGPGTGPAAATLSDEDGGPAYERSAIHHLANRNKRNIALNLRTDAGAEVFRRLIASVDVLIDGYSAGAMEEMGFGWEALRAVNPRLVLIAIPGWGHEGPYRGYVTLGSGLDAATGHVSVRGYPERDASFVPGIYHSDATAALTLVTAVIAGLKRREASAAGCFVDMAQTEAMAWQLPGVFAEWTMNGRVPRRLGNVDPHVVPHGCYRAAGDDRWVVVAAENDAQWAGLAQLIGRPEWSVDGDACATVVGRLGAREQIDAAIAAFTAEREASDAAEAVHAAGAIAAPVVSPPGMLASPQLQSRGWFQTVSHRYAGEKILGGFLWSIAEQQPSWDRPCGLLGEHNREVLAELGYEGEQIDAFARADVIGDRYEPLPAP